MTTEELLSKAHLRFVTDEKPGFTRAKIGKKFIYFDLTGRKITDKDVVEKINALAIPPAWREVWICPHRNGYLQATGFDEKKRKQYRYHPEWNEATSQAKFEHMVLFAANLPKIRKRVAYDLSKKELSREKVLATVVWLLENTLIRVGNEEYEEENKSYGLTTLKNRHVNVRAGEIKFSFKGKSGVYHDVAIKSKRVAKIIRQCQDLPGQDLFEYKDSEGKMQTIDSNDVNEYLKEITGEDITAKDFRTWAGTSLAAKMLDEAELTKNEKEKKKMVGTTVKEVAKHLRNLPATCRKYYIHPAIITAYTKGYTLSNVRHYKNFKAHNIKDLNGDENEVLEMIGVF